MLETDNFANLVLELISPAFPLDIDMQISNIQIYTAPFLSFRSTVLLGLITYKYIALIKNVMQGKLIAVVYTLRTY